MFPASTSGNGTCMIPGPLDMCKTPAPPAPVPPPMPYPNIANNGQANGGTCSGKVQICGKSTIVKGSEITMSSGDEAGVAMGVTSSMIKGTCTFKDGSGKVKAEGKAVSHHMSMTAHNGNNANMPSGQQTVPSQASVNVGG